MQVEDRENQNHFSYGEKLGEKRREIIDIIVGLVNF